MKSLPIVYLISGPLGVGKSTVAKELIDIIDNTKYIEGDKYFHSPQVIDLEWNRRLEQSWNSILNETNRCLKQGLNVVIDFVVEDELDWLKEQFKDKGIKIKYVVLTANNETLKKRLMSRDHLQYLDRSLILLEKLTKDSRNKPYILETDNLDTNQIVQKILNPH